MFKLLDMIDAVELRKGNIVECFGVKTIDYLIKEGTHFTSGDGGTFYSLNPIPLTEEWLIKFGFENKREKWLFEKNGLVINIGNHNCTMHCGNSIKAVDYVHQLQNLYFVLTGKELKIK